MKKLALVVGHNKEDQGAYNYLNETEYVFNSYIAHRVNMYFGDEVQMFLKDDEWKEALAKYSPQFLIELHFNAFSKKAYGCEGLTIKTSEAWDKLLENFSKEFNIKNRGLKELTQCTDRGWKNLVQYRCPAIIFEPCFANFKTEDSEKIIENPEKYIQFLKQEILAIIN